MAAPEPTLNSATPGPFKEWIGSERSWWIAVPPEETLDFARRLRPPMIGGFAMIVGGAVATLVCFKILRLNFPHPVPIVACAIFILGFAVVFSAARFVEPWARARVAARPGRLFAPANNAAFIGLEPAGTYQKMKAVPDEIGFIRRNENDLVFELQRWRGLLHHDDVTGEPISQDGKTFSVLLRCRGEPSLEIVLSPVRMPRGAPFWLAFSGAGRARWLIEWLGVREKTE